ncbi:MAG: hypothetical protein K6G40_10240 [Eubacterium sp.]|nr:hypothetical protein [Eubacterium sp.]
MSNITSVAELRKSYLNRAGESERNLAMYVFSDRRKETGDKTETEMPKRMQA